MPHANIITSDWHLDHNNILTYANRTMFMSPTERDECKRANGRGRVRYSRETMNRHNSHIIEKLNEVAGETDIVWNLGDVLFHGHGHDVDRYYARLAGIRAQIKSKHFRLIWGNHDEMLEFWRNYKLDNHGVPIRDENGEFILKDRRVALTKEQVYSIFEDYCGEVRDRFVLRLNPYRFVLDHYANLVWNGNGRGVCHCYGHSHSNLEPWVQKNMKDAKMVDVGIDNREKLGFDAFTPWTEFELIGFMEGKKGQPVDHHGKKQK